MFSLKLKNFQNPLPPTEVKFIDLSTEPWEDNKRIKIFARITEFTTPPNLTFTIVDNGNHVLSEVTLIENIDTDIVFTMHLRNPKNQNKLQLRGHIFYPEEIGTVDQKFFDFAL